MSALRRSQSAARRSLRTPLVLALLVVSASFASAATLTRGPYLQLLTTTSVTILWQTDVPASCSVALRPAAGGSTTAVAGASGASCAVAVTNLSPGTRYAYTVRADDVALAPESVFQTDHPTRPFSFIVFGDSGTGGIAQYEVRDRMVATRADFLLHTGDMIYETGAAEDYDAKFFWPYASLLSRLDLWPTLGNHDVDMPPGVAWLDVFRTPANNGAMNEKYYSFDYGNAHFVVLDSNTSVKPGTAQYNFLNQDLAATRATWKFVVFHHPVYSSGQHGSSLALRANLIPIFDTYGVDVVLMGHDHDYERTKPMRADTIVESGPATVYVVTGGGGQTLRPIGSNPFTAYAEEVFHFVRVAVNGGSLLFQMIRDDGTVGDTMSLTKGTPAPPAVCGDGFMNQPSEQCDGEDRPACAGACAADCTCVPLCGDGAVNQPSEQCDGLADAACPGFCLSSCTCGDASRFVTLAPVADTFIANGAESTWDHGVRTQLVVDLDTEATTYLRFDLSTVTAPIARATLSLYTVNGSFDGGTAYPVANSSWIEGTQTGTDATSATGPGLKWTDVDTNGDNRIDSSDASPWVPDLLRRLAAFPSPAGQRASVDVTGGLQGGPGVYTLAIVSRNTDGSTYGSRENIDPAKRPSLRIELAPPTTTTTTTTTATLPSTTTTSTTTTEPPTTTTVTVTTTSSSTTTTTLPVVAVVEADVSVRQENAKTNFGVSTVLEVDADTAKRTYLRIRMSGISGRRVEQALLRLTVANVADAESDAGGRISAISSCSWDELAMTWNTAPALDRPVLDTVGPVGIGGVAEFDVASAISGDGTYCFVIDTPSTNMVKYSSREAAAGGPVMILTVAAPPTTTTTTTTTTSTTTTTIATTSTTSTTTITSTTATTSTTPSSTTTTSIPPTTTTTTSSTTTTTVPATATVSADMSVREETPNTKYGASTTLEVDADTRKITYLRVQANGIGSQNVARALLRLVVASAPDSESDSGGQLSAITSCTWDELTTSWNTRPAVDGPVLASVAGAVAVGQNVDFDVTSAIRGDGTYCFALQTLSGNMVKYLARETGPTAPKVILTLAPPTTTTSSTTTTLPTTTSTSTTSTSTTTTTSSTSTTTSTTTTTQPTTTSTSTTTSTTTTTEPTTTTTSSTTSTTTSTTSTTTSTTTTTLPTTTTTSSTTTSTTQPPTTTTSSTTTTTEPPTTTTSSTTTTTSTSTTTATVPTTTSTTTSSTTTTAPPTTTTTTSTTTSTTTTTAPVPRVTTLAVSQGYDGDAGQLLSSQGQLDEWQTSDNRRGRVDHGGWTSLDFNNSSSIAAGQITLVRFCVEYSVDPGLGSGSILWQARTGTLSSPARLSGVSTADDATTSPRIIYTRDGDATACWDAGGTLLSALQADPSRINSLLLVLRDNDANTNLFVDSAGIVVEWTPR